MSVVHWLSFIYLVHHETEQLIYIILFHIDVIVLYSRLNVSSDRSVYMSSASPATVEGPVTVTMSYADITIPSRTTPAIAVWDSSKLLSYI